MIEKLFAGITLVLCLALLLRMALGRTQQARWDAFWRRQLHRARRAGDALRQLWRRTRSSPRARRQAADAIERARRGRAGTTREGNVIRPGRFQRDDDDKPPLH